MILTFKLLLTPLMITISTLIGRRWGPAVSGWLIGFPFTSGPVSFILASQFGAAFAAQAAVGTLGGELCVLAFCLVYSFAALRFRWPGSLLLGVTAYGAVAVLVNGLSLQLLPTFLVVVAASLLVIHLIPRQSLAAEIHHPPAWDIPARMLIATTFVFVLTSAADRLGPQLSGVIAPFPIYGIVLATFAHLQQGAPAARQLLRGGGAGFLCLQQFLPGNRGLAAPAGPGLDLPDCLAGHPAGQWRRVVPDAQEGIVSAWLNPLGQPLSNNSFCLIISWKVPGWRCSIQMTFSGRNMLLARLSNAKGC